MEQLREFRAMNEHLGEFTDRINPEFFSVSPVDATEDPVHAYGRRELSVFDLADVNGRALITAGRPKPGFELLYAAHAEMSAVISISSFGVSPIMNRAESFWVSRHGVTQSRFATPPESEDGVLWLEPFEHLLLAVLEVADLPDSLSASPEFRVPVKRAAVKNLYPRAQAFAAIADAVRKVRPDLAGQLDAGNGRELSLHVSVLNEDGPSEIEHSWVVTPVGAVVVEFERERIFRADTFITGVSLYELRRRIEEVVPGEALRRYWTQLAARTAAVRIDTTIPA